MKKKTTALVIGLALVAGVFAGAIVSSPIGASAQETTDDVTTEDTTTRVTVRDVLDDLVEDGTLTADQADAVADALADARLERAHGRHSGGGHGHFGSETLSEVLGLEPGELRDALLDGQTIADLAAAAGITTDDVVDAIVAAAQERLDAAVADGRIDEDEAAEKLADVEEHATDLVDGDFEFGERDGRHDRAHDGRHERDREQLQDDQLDT